MFKKNDGIVEVEVVVVVVMIDFVVVLECWGLSFLKVPIIVFYHSLYVCLLNWFIIDSKTRIADSTLCIYVMNVFEMICKTFFLAGFYYLPISNTRTQSHNL